MVLTSDTLAIFFFFFPCLPLGLGRRIEWDHGMLWRCQPTESSPWSAEQIFFWASTWSIPISETSVCAVVKSGPWHDDDNGGGGDA